MNKHKWLVAGLSLVMAASIGVGISACGGEKGPETPEHTHVYDTWDHNDTDHWKYCDEHGTDKSNIDETTRANHTFKDGKCECGATEGSGPVTPAELDTREFYVVGGGMGDLATGTWAGPNASFKFTKAEKPDENGYTVYTYQMKLYSADEFKFIEKNTISQGTDAEGKPTTVWDDATTFKLSDLDVTAVPDAFKGDDNIVVNTGKDGVYKFTLLTKKGGSAKENKMKVELVEPVEALDIEAQYEMYLVGSIVSKAGTLWPSQYDSLEKVKQYCYKLELQEDGKTFSAEVKLSTKDSFKVWNYKTGNASAGYYPTGEGGNLTVSKDGWYVVSWKVGEAKPTITPHEHRYTEWGHNAEEHWKQCPLDEAIDETTKAGHNFSEGKCECGALEADSCAHDGKINYEYTAVPEAVAEGDTLKGKCAKCGKEVDVEYKKGFTGNGATPIQPTNPIGDISEVGTYYFTTGSKYQTLGMKVTEAGTYTLTFEEVCDLNNGQGQLGIMGLAFGKSYVAMFSMPNAAISIGNVSAAKGADLTTYAVQVNGKTLAVSDDLIGNLETLSFTVTAEQLEAGELYVTIHLGGYQNDAHTTIAAENSLSHLVTVTKSAAASISAPAEVAMLPGKEE